jgi:PcfJ-like protein
MDAKPKSNKIKRLERRRKLEEQAIRRSREHTQSVARARNELADQVLKGSDSTWRGTKHLLQMIIQGKVVRVSQHSDLFPIAQLYAGINSSEIRKGYPQQPDVRALERLVLTCHGQTDLFRGREAHRYANALLALSAHTGRWLRSPDDWKVRSHNRYRQFHALVRHVLARYNVPVFMNTAWLEGLTAQGVVHQRWFIHVAQGQNIRTATGLPISLTRKQANHFLEVPDDYDIMGGFRSAQITDLGGSERLARSILSTRIATDFQNDEFWLSVFRWFIANPMLDPVHHGPIIDYLYDQRFVASVHNPIAHLTGQPRLLPLQPNLTMKGRNPTTVLREVDAWHRRLGRDRSSKATWWAPSGMPPFCFDEGDGHNRKVYTITELLSSRELEEEGEAMCHCVGSYVGSCAAGRTSIWVLKAVDAYDRAARLLTLEIWNASRQIVQARQKFNKEASPKELSIVKRWASEGGPSLSKLLAR